MVANHSRPSLPFQTEGVRSEVGFSVTQSIGSPVDRAVNGGYTPIGIVVQFFLADLVDSLIAGHPQISGIVLHDGAHSQVEEPLIDGVGSNAVQLRLRVSPKVVAPLGFGLAVKLLVAPLSALLVCRLSGLSGMVVDVSIIEAAMPPMVTAGALAVIAGLDADLAVALIGIGIVLSFGTLPAIFWLVKMMP